MDWSPTCNVSVARRLEKSIAPSPVTLLGDADPFVWPDDAGVISMTSEILAVLAAVVLAGACVTTSMGLLPDPQAARSTTEGTRLPMSRRIALQSGQTRRHRPWRGGRGPQYSLSAARREALRPARRVTSRASKRSMCRCEALVSARHHEQSHPGSRPQDGDDGWSNGDHADNERERRRPRQHGANPSGAAGLA